MEIQQSLAAKFQALFPHLDERQRRLLAGAEARALGRGGVRVVAKAADMHEGTVTATRGHPGAIPARKAQVWSVAIDQTVGPMSALQPCAGGRDGLAVAR